MKSTEIKEKKEPLDPFSMTRIEVNLTYDYLIPDQPLAITFFMRLEQCDEEVLARQEFFALSEDERKKKVTEHQANRMALLSVQEPAGIPGFTNANADYRQAIRDFFSGDNALKGRILDDALSQYEVKTRPREFFR